MQENKIYAVYARKRTTISNKQHKKYPYLLKELKVTYANQAWAIDITYIKLTNGYVYLIGIIDLFSRKIVGWALSPFLDKAPSVEAFEEAIKKYGVPHIVNSDQGCQFTSEQWIKLVESFGALVSMDGKGRWADNIFIERFWRSLKWEAIYLHTLNTLEEAEKVIADYIEHYNNERPHQSLCYKTPQLVYIQSLQERELLEQNSTLLNGDNILIKNMNLTRNSTQNKEVFVPLNM